MDYTPQTSVQLLAPDKALELSASLSGPRTLGVCDSLSLSGRKSKGGGGRKLVYNWAVKFADSVNVSSLHSNVTTGLQALKDKLAGMVLFYYNKQLLILLDRFFLFQISMSQDTVSGTLGLIFLQLIHNFFMFRYFCNKSKILLNHVKLLVLILSKLKGSNKLLMRKISIDIFEK